MCDETLVQVFLDVFLERFKFWLRYTLESSKESFCCRLEGKFVVTGCVGWRFLGFFFREKVKKFVVFCENCVVFRGFLFRKDIVDFKQRLKK